MPIGRNDTCFCGSGKRYKHCHGALGSSEAPPLDEAMLRRSELMTQALAFQNYGDLPRARALYEEVLSADPSNFDALHMTGVIAYQLGDFDQAERYIEHSLKVRPLAHAAVANLSMVQTARSLVELEGVWCERILPLLADSCRLAAQARRLLSQEVHVYLPDEAAPSAALAPLIEGLSPVKLWSAKASPNGKISAIHYREGKFPRSGTLLIARPCCQIGDWFDRFPSDGVMLFLETRDARSTVDGIAAASRDGRNLVKLIYSSSDVQQSIGLPGDVVSEMVELAQTRMHS